MKRFLKSAFARIAPRTTAGILAARARAHSQRYFAELGMADLNRRLSAHFGDRVIAGPFAGMRLPPGAWLEQLGPYLLGTFEQELHPWVERVIAAEPVRVIDVGSKFGYYVAGFATRLPMTEVIAYDIDPWARRQTKAIANLNGLCGRVRVRGFCSSSGLRSDVMPETLILSDCEGYESILFSQGCGEAYSGTTLLVEIHDTISPGVTAQLAKVFSQTHTLESIRTIERKYTGPPLDFLTANEFVSAIHEIRGEQEWALFTPKKYPGAPEKSPS